MAQKKKGYFLSNAGGTERVIAYGTMESTGWITAVSVPADFVFAEVAKLKLMYAVLTIVGVALIAAALLFFSNGIVKQVIALTGHINEMANGNLRLEPLAANSTDEFGQPILDDNNYPVYDYVETTEDGEFFPCEIPFYTYPNRWQYGDGVLIYKILLGGSAHKAGLERGDLILSIDGEKVTTVTELRNKVMNKKIGDKVRIRYSRDGKEDTATVTLQESGQRK